MIKRLIFGVLILISISLFLSVVASDRVSAQGTSGVCRGFRTRFSVGMTARVSSGSLNLRAFASATAARLTSLTSGATMRIIGGPRCNQYTWWQVNSNGRSGWVAELGNLISAPTDSGSVLAGVASGEGGAGPDFAECAFFVSLDTTIAYHLADLEMSAFESFASGDTFNPKLGDFDFGVCAPTGTVINPADVTLIPPNNFPIEPNVTIDDTVNVPVSVNDNEVSVWIPYLPQFWCTSGLWELRVGDFSLFIDVRDINLLMQETAIVPPCVTIVAGFAAHERVAIMENNPVPQGDEFPGFVIEETRADENGLVFYMKPDASFLAMIGEQGNVFINKLDGVSPIFVIDQEFLCVYPFESILFDSIWRGLPFVAGDWRCQTNNTLAVYIGTGRSAGVSSSR